MRVFFTNDTHDDGGFRENWDQALKKNRVVLREEYEGREIILSGLPICFYRNILRPGAGGDATRSRNKIQTILYAENINAF
jgi:hypothetical protein